MPSRKELKELDVRIDTYCEQNQITGTLRITSHDTIVMEKHIGFATREENIPFSEQSLFSFYSLSKPFCVIGLLMLSEMIYETFFGSDGSPSEHIEMDKGYI